MAVFYAFCCLALTACNDLLFKFFARKPRSRGMFVAIVGMIWFLIVGWKLFTGTPESWTATLFWAVISGFFSVAGNLLLIEAMSGLGAGVCSTIYRLNLFPVVLGAWLLLGENLSRSQWIGVGCAVAAVIAFFPKGSRNAPAGNSRASVRWAFGAVMLAAFLRAGMGLSYRYGFLHGADRSWVVAINALFWVFGGLWYAWKREKCEFKVETKVLRYGLLSGAFVTGIVVFMAASLQYGEASVVLPIAQMSFLLTALLSAWLLKEKLTPRTLFALGCGIAAILLLARNA